MAAGKVGSWRRSRDREKAVAALGREVFGIADEQKEGDGRRVGVRESGEEVSGRQGGVTGPIEELGGLGRRGIAAAWHIGPAPPRHVGGGSAMASELGLTLTQTIN